MTIVQKSPAQKLFDDPLLDTRNPNNRRMYEPRVHNKYHGTAPADAVYIGRGSPWGNPYVIGEHGSREAVIERFRWHVLPHLDLTPLRGKHLVCFCKPKACHGDVLLEAANR